jgi:hypothetical protein
LHHLLFTFLFLAAQGVKDASNALTSKTQAAAQGAGRKAKETKQKAKSRLSKIGKSIENFFS